MELVGDMMDDNQEYNIEAVEKNDPEINKYLLAGFWVRFIAYSLDLLLLSAFATGLISYINTFFNQLILNSLGVSIVSIGIIASLYFVLMTGIIGQTLGKIIMGIKVIDLEGKKPDWLTVFFREAIGRLISQLGGLHLGYIWIAFQGQKQGWHDKFADTYVVYEEDLQEKNILSVQMKL